MDYVYYNVNEDGVPYLRGLSSSYALMGLTAFPNDTIVVVTEHSRSDKFLFSQMEETE